MKNIFLLTFTLLLIGVFLTIHPALAGERVKVYEMAESGITIEFAAETTDKAVLEAVAEKNPIDDSKM